jgi:uncharacterized protein YqhQ
MSASPSTSPAEGTHNPTPPYIGGQAVLEGVMMRSPRSFAVVVRRADGSLHVRERSVPDGRTGVWRWPLARGVASLVESLRLGSEALRFSADQMERDMEAAERAEKSAAKAADKSAASPADKSVAKKKAAEVGGATLRALTALGYTLFLLTTRDDAAAAEDPPADSAKASAGEPASDDAAPDSAGAPKKRGAGGGLMLIIMVAFLFALPQAAAAGVNKLFGLALEVQSPAFQAITGAFKLTIVVGYLLLIRSLLPDIRRVFQYHGAEHKTISTYEAGEELNVDNARAKTTLHPRCGTTFLVMVAIVSILVFTAIGGFLPRIDTGRPWLDNAIFLVEKLPFIPVIAAVTFEIQRVFAKYCTTGPLRLLLVPGFLCQRITTIEPDDAQLEVALASLRVTLLRERGAASTGGDVRFASFDSLMRTDRLRRAA